MPESPKEIRNEYIQKLREEIEEIKEKQSRRGEARLRERVEKLTDKANKIASSTMSLQSKITELLIKITDNLEAQKEIVNLLKEASTVEEGENPMQEILKQISEQNKEIIDHLSENKKYLKSMSDVIERESTRSTERTSTGGTSRSREEESFGSYGRY